MSNGATTGGAVTDGRTAGPARLHARTRRVDHDFDLLDVAGDHGSVWERDGHGIAGRGVALRLEVSLDGTTTSADQVAQVLAGIHHEDDVGRPGAGPVAIGALPFDPAAAPGELVVPSIAAGRATDGTRWVTTIGDHDNSTIHDTPVIQPINHDLRPDPAPGRYTVAPEQDPEEWMRSVAAARDELISSGHRKVVLARSVRVLADNPFHPSAVLRSLRSTYPSCMLFSSSGFVGASPELLVSRLGDVVRAHPMAGTAPRSADPTTDARLAASLLASHKDREEHQITIDMVHDTLLPWCSYLDWEPEPQVVAMANVQHLATRMEGRLSSPPAPVLELLSALHPTPAVCGDPRESALAMIGRFEAFDRGRYAGPVGWTDADGNGEWAVGIRSAELDGTTARLFAGVGVVAESDPGAELEETRVKLQAMLSALVRP